VRKPAARRASANQQHSPRFHVRIEGELPHGGRVVPAEKEKGLPEKSFEKHRGVW
jgi:hypothetical protein